MIAAPAVPTHGRHTWVLADLRCMLCGRVLGRLIGALPCPTGASGATRAPRPTAWSVRHFAAFRPRDSGQPAVRLTGREHFRCSTCGGAAVVEDVEAFTTYDDPVDDADGGPPRRGRPPKPWRNAPDSRLRDLGLAG